MSATVIVVLLAVHALAGAFWLGAMLVNAGFLLPAVRATGPAGGQVMKDLVHVRRLPRYINIAVLLTLATGVALYWRASGGFVAAWIGSGYGLSMSLGAVLTVAAAVVGHWVNAPTAARLGQVGAAVQAQGGPPNSDQAAEIQRLQARLARATQAAAALLALALVTMVAARFA